MFGARLELSISSVTRIVRHVTFSNALQRRFVGIDKSMYSGSWSVDVGNAVSNYLGRQSLAHRLFGRTCTSSSASIMCSQQR